MTSKGLAWAATLAVALLAAGCGGNDEEGESTPPNPAMKSSHGWGWSPRKFPAITPAMVSSTAEDSAISAEIAPAKNANKVPKIKCGNEFPENMNQKSIV